MHMYIDVALFISLLVALLILYCLHSFIESSYVTFLYSVDAIIVIVFLLFFYIAAALSEGSQNKISFTLMYLYTRCNK